MFVHTYKIYEGDAVSRAYTHMYADVDDGESCWGREQRKGGEKEGAGGERIRLDRPRTTATIAEERENREGGNQALKVVLAYTEACSCIYINKSRRGGLKVQSPPPPTALPSTPLSTRSVPPPPFPLLLSAKVTKWGGRQRKTLPVASSSSSSSSFPSSSLAAAVAL